MTRIARILTCTLAAGAVEVVACSSSPPPDPTLADVVYEGQADQTALQQLLAATPVSDPAKGPTIDSPTTGSLLSQSTVQTFTWHPAAATAALLRRPPSLLPPPPVEHAGWLRDLIGPERAAWAGEEPMSGRGYLLLFTTDTNPRLLRVFTTAESYKPDAKAWQILGSAHTWTTLKVVSASFDEDQLVEGSGPFVGASIQFCIEQ